MTQHGPSHIGPEQYLDALRAALGARRHRDAIDALRNACDDWTIGGGRIDPCEPLTNRGRRTITWPSPEWDSISSDFCSRLRSAVEGTSPDWSPGTMSPDLAGYIAYSWLELRARETPAHDEERVVGDALVIAARHGVEPALFRRYLVGWQDRAAPLEGDGPAPDWSMERVVRVVALGVALGSEADPHIGPRVARCRSVLDAGAAARETRFRDFVPADERGVWKEIAAASSGDAAAWAARFMG